MATHRRRSSAGRVVVTSFVVCAMALGTPGFAAAAPRPVNAHRVDGFHAVGAKASKAMRKGKLVATDTRTGRLPNNIIARAPNAQKLAGRTYAQVVAGARTTYSAGEGLALSGDEFSVDSSSVQSRVAEACAAGRYIRAIEQDGSVTCDDDASGPAYTTGSGINLSGGNVLSLAKGAVTPEHVTSAGQSAAVLASSTLSQVSSVAVQRQHTVHDAGGEPHRVLVNGVVNLYCSDACPEPATVRYQLKARNAMNQLADVSPAMWVSVDRSVPYVVVPIVGMWSQAGALAGTSVTYEVHAQITAATTSVIQVERAVLTTLDTGRAG